MRAAAQEEGPVDRRNSRGGRGRREHRRGGASRPRPAAAERLSRFLAFVLRHHPEEIGLTLDETGSADLEAVLAGLRRRPGFEAVRREHIERLAASGPGAARFEIAGDCIRARYGHSLRQPIAYPAAAPPEDLFHGTSPEIAEMILSGGLTAGERQRVHLSADTPAAREVGLRRSPSPVILRIDTASAARAGVRFYRAAPSVWLSDDIPPEHITRLE